MRTTCVNPECHTYFLKSLRKCPECGTAYVPPKSARQKIPFSNGSLLCVGGTLFLLASILLTSILPFEFSMALGWIVLATFVLSFVTGITLICYENGYPIIVGILLGILILFGILIAAFRLG